MTQLQNMSTRRLKRAYLRAVKTVWNREWVAAEAGPTSASAANDLARAVAQLQKAAAELNRRGWNG